MKREEILIGEKEIIIETGRLAKQANGSVLLRRGDTVVLVTAVMSDDIREGIDFFPLTVEYIEKAAAAGKIPGGYIKREGKPATHEILNARVIDRSIRPLFPEDLKNEVQVVATVLSADPLYDPDILCISGASLALMISDIPWNGPVVGIRICKLGINYIINPTRDERQFATLDFLITVNEEGLVMVEGHANEASENEVLEAFFTAQEAAKPFIELMKRWRVEVGKEKVDYKKLEPSLELIEAVKKEAIDKLREAVFIPEKKPRQKAIKKVYKEVMEALSEAFPAQEGEINLILNKLKHDLIRERIVKEGIRIDGRRAEDIRNIWCEVGWLPRAHGSAIFTRGETQALVTCTLGSGEDEQMVETLFGEERERFMLHYNFPPYSVGEIKPFRGPGRREIGHGNLAKMALQSVLPPEDDFPYAIRVVSDISESNGSSSMATVCGGTLAMMDAGIPISKPVAGIAMGLIQQDDKVIILSDILGDEDHVGDMDFKVAGTVDGVTAIQLDNKIGSISKEVMERALEQAKKGRLFILDKMLSVIKEPRKELSPYAPRILATRIRPSRIRDLIGPGGRTIQDIQAETNTKIIIEEDGLVKIYSSDLSASQKALERIEDLTKEVEVGKIYKGVVTAVKDFGAFVKIYYSAEGLLHISEIQDQRVNNIYQLLKVGQEVVVKVLGVDRTGKIRLSRKQALKDLKYNNAKIENVKQKV